LTGSNSLTVAFGCDCPAGLTRVWDFGDGEVSNDESPAHTYPPGRYRVRLSGVDAQGCVGTDSVEVVVDKPPFLPPVCVAAAAPNSGPVPLTATLAGKYVDPNPGGVIRSAQWFLPDGTTRTEPTLRLTLDTAQVFKARLKVTNDQNLSCTDYAEVVAQTPTGDSPPQILSPPATAATCDQPYHYAPGSSDKPLVRGTRPIVFSLGKQVGGETFGAPAGMAVDSLTGQVSWTPGKGDARTEHVTLVAKNGAGSTVQEFDVQVACDKPREDFIGECRCSGGPMGALALAAAALALRRRRQKGHGPKASAQGT
jgi:hypothetical protein